MQLDTTVWQTFYWKNFQILNLLTKRSPETAKLGTSSFELLSWFKIWSFRFPRYQTGLVLNISGELESSYSLKLPNSSGLVGFQWASPGNEIEFQWGASKLYWVKTEMCGQSLLRHLHDFRHFQSICLGLLSFGHLKNRHWHRSRRRSKSFGKNLK